MLILDLIFEADGVPEIRACYTEGEWCVMAMQLLGASLSDLLLDFELTLKVVLVLADQMVRYVRILTFSLYQFFMRYVLVLCA